MFARSILHSLHHGLNDVSRLRAHLCIFSSNQGLLNVQSQAARQIQLFARFQQFHEIGSILNSFGIDKHAMVIVSSLFQFVFDCIA